MEILTPISMWLGPRSSGSAPAPPSPFNGHATLANNIVSYWKLDETSGTRVDSVTASGNDLTDNNTVTSATGVISNGAFYVAANSEYLSRADNASLSLGADSAFTVSAWVKLVSYNRPIVTKRAGVGAATEYMLNQGLGGGGVFNMVVGDNNGHFGSALGSTGGIPNLNQLYFVVGWHDPATDVVGIAVNGGAADTVSYATGTFDGGGEFRLGGDQGGSSLMDGLIDEVGFWGRVLTAQERTDLYNSGAGLTY